MRVINLREGMELFYINQDNSVKQCTYLYTNKNGKKYVSFISKKGNVAYKFLPKGTLFFNNKEEVFLKIEEIEVEKRKNEKEMIKKMELFHKQYLLEKEELSKKIIKRIEESENINHLPLYKDLLELIDENDTELLNETLLDSDIFNQCFVMTIKDGSKVTFEPYAYICFSDKEHWYLYYIPDEDIYICMECGLWQKSSDKLKEEVGYIDDRNKLLLPYNWNEYGIKAYLKKRIEKQQGYEERAEMRRRVQEEREKLQSEDNECSYCIHMKNNECECCEDEENCDSFEPR